MSILQTVGRVVAHAVLSGGSPPNLALQRSMKLSGYKPDLQAHDFFEARVLADTFKIGVTLCPFFRYLFLFQCDSEKSQSSF